MASFAGIDLTSSPKKPSAYALLDGELRISFRERLHTDRDIIAAVELDLPTTVAIDAPLSLPKGLCCLDEDCLCHPESGEKGRLCERELAKLGIGCFFTTKRSIIERMVHRAINLKNGLLARGYQVIEVYPYASKVRLWGRPAYKKTTNRGVEFLRAHLAMTVPDIERNGSKLTHDHCDAVIAAYTACLHYRGKVDLIGDPDEGQIFIPC